MRTIRRYLLLTLMTLSAANAWGAKIDSDWAVINNMSNSFFGEFDLNNNCETPYSTAFGKEHLFDDAVLANRRGANAGAGDALNGKTVAPNKTEYSDWYEFVAGTQYKFYMEKNSLSSNDEAKITLLSAGDGFGTILNGWGNAAPIGQGNNIQKEFNVSKDGQYRFELQNSSWNGSSVTISNFRVVTINNGVEIPMGSGGSVDQLDISQGTQSLNIPSSGYDEVETIELNLNLDGTNWHPLFVPVQLTYDDWKDKFEVAKIMNFHDYEGKDDNRYVVLEVQMINAGTLKENHPYIIRAKTSGNKTITLSNRKVFPAPATNELTCASTETIYKFIGKYSASSVANDDYILSSGYLNSGAMINEGSHNINACEWYMTTKDRSGDKKDKNNYSKARIAIRLSGFSEEEVIEDMVTGIAINNDNTCNAEMRYTLDGRQTTTLRRGINIIRMSDGSVKKVWVR